MPLTLFPNQLTRKALASTYPELLGYSPANSRDNLLLDSLPPGSAIETIQLGDIRKVVSYSWNEETGEETETYYWTDEDGSRYSNDEIVDADNSPIWLINPNISYQVTIVENLAPYRVALATKRAQEAYRQIIDAPLGEIRAELEEMQK